MQEEWRLTACEPWTPLHAASGTAFIAFADTMLCRLLQMHQLC